MKRLLINQTMKEFDKKVSNLVFDLEAKDSAENTLWIKEVKQIGRAAKKEYVDHKVLTYKTLATFLERDVLDVNEVVHRDYEDKDSLRWYSVTSLNNYKPFYNKPVIPQTDGGEEVNGALANVEEVD